MTLQAYAQIVEEKLNELLPEGTKKIPETGEIPWLLANAMRYSVMAGGKRLRPAMLLAAAVMLGVEREEALLPACALEMIHTYSLIHDDLPGMDNDTLRRGRPTNHVVFGEGQAILAGDGLLTTAVDIMLQNAMAYPQHAVRHNEAIWEIVNGAGNMVSGQSMDLYSERENVRDAELLHYIHLHKTACMLVAPLRAAGRLAGLAPDSEEVTALTVYAVNFGLLFQVVDDILDVTGDEDKLGKSTGKDASSGKLTYVTFYGLEKARAFADERCARGKKALACFGEKAKFFDDLLNAMRERVS